MLVDDLIQRWSAGRARADGQSLQIAPASAGGLVDKWRRAYRWIAEQALFPGATDLDFGVGSRVQHAGASITLAGGESLSSFVLLPLLTLMTSRRMVFVGAPGRGKTSMAVLMALLSGHTLAQVRRAVQHGHPQLTTADLLGSPLPSDLVQAQSARDIRVAWREWITLRVKIIDEYNRIPTKTQSSLLSLLSEGYAEMYEQVIESGRSAWYLTANDDLGGGTFPVIEALKDRIDVVARCAPFHAQHLERLAARIESSTAPEQFIPRDLVFSVEDQDAVDRELRAIPIPADVLEALGYFLSQLEFCRRASDQIEFMNKDTLHIAGRRVGQVCNEDCPLDKHAHLCTQTENGISPRTYQSILHYAKALAFFRGAQEVSVDDLRQLLPWTLLDKLKINTQSAFFQKAENRVLLTDRASWIRQMFDRALQQHAAYQPVRGPLKKLIHELAGAEQMSTSELQDQMTKIRQLLQQLLEKNELNGPLHADLIQLKGLYARCQDLLRQRRPDRASELTRGDERGSTP